MPAITTVTTAAAATLLLLCFAAAVADAQRLSGSFPIDLRVFWDFSGGYCGEASFQMVAAARGYWLSQKAARTLAGGELLLGYNDKGLCNALKFNCTYIYTTNPQSFAVVAKKTLIAKQPLVFASFLNGLRDPDYDHIMPLYRVSYDAATANVYSANDEWSWTPDNGANITRALNVSGFFAPSGAACPFTLRKGGCVPSSPAQYGTVVGGLKDAKAVYLPLRLTISSWVSSSGVLDTTLPALQEPLAGSSNPKRFGRYSLTLGGPGNVNAGLAAGQEFTVARCDGTASVPENPATFADAVQGCTKRVTFTVGQAGLGGLLSDATFGTVLSTSVTYFIAGRGRV